MGKSISKKVSLRHQIISTMTKVTFYTPSTVYQLKTHLITIAKKTNQLLNSIHERLKIIQNFKNIVEKFDNLTNNFEVEHKNLLDKIEKVEKFDYEKLVVFDVTEFTRGLDRLSSIQYELIRVSKESSGVEVYQNTNNQNILRHRRHSSNSRYEDW